MMTRATRRGLVLVSVLAALTFWLNRDEDSDGDGPIEGLDTRLDYALEAFEMRAFDETGAPAMRLWSPRLTNEAATNIGRVENPRVEVRHEGYLWNIMADMATISENQEEVLLAGSVTLERRGALPSDRLDMESRQVTLVVNDRIARSDENVRMVDSAGVLEARGFEVDMIANEFQLNHDVQGVYVLPPQTR